MWDESVDYTPEQQCAYESLLVEHYDIDPQYFIDKYNIPIIGVKKKEDAPGSEGKGNQKLEKPFFD